MRLILSDSRIHGPNGNGCEKKKWNFASHKFSGIVAVCSTHHIPDLLSILLLGSFHAGSRSVTLTWPLRRGWKVKAGQVGWSAEKA
jgi:hypothetical protein